MPKKPGPAKKTSHGGEREGAGRRPTDNPRGIIYPIRLTPEERAKLDELGGAAWIRERIRLAKPKE